MDDTCPVCGEEMPFIEEAEAAYEIVRNYVKERAMAHIVDGRLPDGFGDAILDGLMQGLVAGAADMSRGSRHEGVEEHLVELLAHAVSIELTEDPEGSMMQ